MKFDLENKILIYKILYKLYSKGIYLFSVDDLDIIYDQLKIIVDTYNVPEITVLTQNKQKFINSFILIFTYFDMGVYKNNTLKFF